MKKQEMKAMTKVAQLKDVPALASAKSQASPTAQKVVWKLQMVMESKRDVVAKLNEAKSKICVVHMTLATVVAHKERLS